MSFLLRSHRLRTILTALFVALLVTGPQVSLTRAALSPSLERHSYTAQSPAPFVAPLLVWRIGTGSVAPAQAVNDQLRHARNDRSIDRTIHITRVGVKRKLVRRPAPSRPWATPAAPANPAVSSD